MPAFTFQIVQLLQMYGALYNIAQQTQVPRTVFLLWDVIWDYGSP